MNIKRRPGQHPDESPIEYIRRVASNSEHEHESLWDDMPSIEACFEFFELWHVYDTDFWSGILEAIGEGENPKAAQAFIGKWRLPDPWTEDVAEAVRLSMEPAQ